MEKKLQWAIGCAAAAAAPLAALWGTAEYIMRIASDRDAPASYTRSIEKKGTDSAFASLEAGYEKLRCAPHEVVEIRSYGGLWLTGHWFEQPDARRVILAVHGWRSHWYRDFSAVADFWRENGCSVLYIEQRAQGESEGKYMGFGLLERYDCLDWLRWISRRCGTDIPVYLAGISMGASTVLLTADQEMPANVRGILADCGFTSPDAIWRHVAERSMPLPYSLLRPFANLSFRRRTGLSPTTSTVEALRRCPLPVLLFHGEADTFVPVEMSRENYAACAGPKRLLTVPGAIHGLSYVVDREEYEAAEKQFWADFDA